MVFSGYTPSSGIAGSYGNSMCDIIHIFLISSFALLLLLNLYYPFPFTIKLEWVIYSCLYFQPLVGHLHLEYQRNQNINRPQTHLIPCHVPQPQLYGTIIQSPRSKTSGSFPFFSLCLIFACSFCTMS